MRVPVLIMTMILLTCCSPYLGACPAPVKASDETKEWFRASSPLPSHVADYLDRIGRQQEKLRLRQ